MTKKRKIGLAAAAISAALGASGGLAQVVPGLVASAQNHEHKDAVAVCPYPLPSDLCKRFS